MKISVNKTFANRGELDAYVRSTFGEDAQANAGVAIEIAPEEMTALALDESTTVYGVKVAAAEASDVVAKEGPVRAVFGGRRKAKKKK